jgi:ubiquinone/menaquinone biosynthesis C-methylase UbiE
MHENATRTKNVDKAVINDFGKEWSQFNQSSLSDEERLLMFEGYFSVFPWRKLPQDPMGFDAGCGTGRWAVLVAPRVRHLHCIDPSSAIEIAKINLKQHSNCSFYQSTVNDMPLEDNSMDFGYSLGVLHHVTDTQQGISACVRKLKPGAPFLVYLYYAFDNKPRWFKVLWRISDVLRRIISELPYLMKYIVTQIIALLIYFPLARMAKALEKIGIQVDSLPLSAYRNRSFYSMRTDALDRFGTKLEKRFSKEQIYIIMEKAGLENIEFSESVPFWCAVGYKKQEGMKNDPASLLSQRLTGNRL